MAIKRSDFHSFKIIYPIYLSIVCLWETYRRQLLIYIFDSYYYNILKHNKYSYPSNFYWLLQQHKLWLEQSIPRKPATSYASSNNHQVTSRIVSSLSPPVATTLGIGSEKNQQQPQLSMNSEKNYLACKFYFFTTHHPTIQNYLYEPLEIS